MVQASGGGGGGGYGLINKGNVFKKKSSLGSGGGLPQKPRNFPQSNPQAKSRKAPPRPRPHMDAPPRPRGGGGGGGYNGGSSSNGMGSSRGGQISYSPPPPPPKPPSLKDFLGADSTYAQQQSALQKAKSDYLAQQNKTKTQYQTSYAGDLDTLGKNRTAALADLENDYAGRGLLQSGLYADSLADTNNDWNKRQGSLEQARAAFLSGLTDDWTNFSQEQTLTMQKAQQEAAARRAAQYGI